MSQAQALVLVKEGIAAAKAGNKVQARLQFRQALELDASNEAALLWLAGLAESPLEAVHFLECVLALNPQHEKARTAIRAARVQAGIAALKGQDKVQARLLLRKAVEHDPASEMGWLWLASVAQTPEEALHHLEKVLEINPANDRARSGILRYRAQVAEATGPAAPVMPSHLAAGGEPSRNHAEQNHQDRDGGHDAVRHDSVRACPPPHTPEVAAARDAQAEEAWECPFCAAQAPQPLDRCPQCHALLTLSHPESFFRPLNVDSSQINTAIERLERIDPASDAVVAYQLGLAYLNLKQFDAALELLQQAVEQRPEDRGLSAEVDALVQLRLTATPSRSRERKQRKTILVVDDSPTIRKLVTMTMERRGYATRTAADGYEAIDVIRDWGVPDLILLDITMPGMDGYQLCKLLRENADTTNVPIIMLSGKDGFFSKVRGRMAGSTEYITKPFEPEGLVRVVERYCIAETPH